MASSSGQSCKGQGDGDMDIDAIVTAGRLSSQLESELENVCRELGLVEEKLAELLAQQGSLIDRKNQLTKELKARKKRREFWL